MGNSPSNTTDDGQSDVYRGGQTDGQMRMERSNDAGQSSSSQASPPAVQPVQASSSSDAPVAVGKKIQKLSTRKANRLMTSWARNHTTYVRLATLGVLLEKIPESTRSAFRAELKGKDVKRVVEQLEKNVDHDFYSRISYLVGLTHAYTNLPADLAAKLSDIMINDSSDTNINEIEIRDTVAIIDAARMMLVDHVQIAVMLLKDLISGKNNLDRLSKSFYGNAGSLGRALDNLFARDAFYEPKLDKYSELIINHAVAVIGGRFQDSKQLGQELDDTFQEFGAQIAKDLDDYLVPYIQKL